MAGYIMDLRRAVGHRLLMQVGASVIVEDDRGRILLQLRSDSRCWGYHGGSVELDERVEDAARRELLEETGLAAGEMTLFGVFSGPEMHNIYPNGDEVSCVDIVFLCRDYSGEMRCQPGEVEALRFFSADQLPRPLSPPTIPALRQWAEAKIKESQAAASRVTGLDAQAPKAGTPCAGNA